MANRAKLTNSQRRLAERIYERGAVKFGLFKLKLHEKNPESPLSPTYINLRRSPDGPLSEKDIEVVGRELYTLVRRRKILFDVVAGIPKAGDPLAEVVARLAKRPLIKLGKIIQGNKRKIDFIIGGEYRPNQLVLLVDDLITQADTKKEAIAVCEGAGLIVVGLVVLIDREQGGAEDLKGAGYDLYAVFSFSALLDYYVRINRIEPQKRQEVREYIAKNRV